MEPLTGVLELLTRKGNGPLAKELGCWCCLLSPHPHNPHTKGGRGHWQSQGQTTSPRLCLLTCVATTVSDAQNGQVLSIWPEIHLVAPLPFPVPML
jgi:hypothetical protein